MFKKNTGKSIFITLIFCLFTAFSSKTTAAEVNYDTAWTFVYDGGKLLNGTVIPDMFYETKSLPDGSIFCVGSTCDTTSPIGQILLMKINVMGIVLWKKLFKKPNSNIYAHSLAISKNNDLIIGGRCISDPFIMRTDSLGNLKWSTWYYDSIKDQSKLQHSATINCLRETSRGTIICAAGDDYPNNNGSALNNYAAVLEFDSAGKVKRYREWNNVTGYKIGGFDIEETDGGQYLLAGNQAVFYLDTTGKPGWQSTYSYQLADVGSEVANINRAKVLRDNKPLILGQVYEGNCWTNYKKFYYDAWWSPISYDDGSITTWDTAGTPRADDVLYDFTQLDNGNLVFIGNKGGTNGTIPVWILVTDSTGKQILWEKEYAIMKSTAVTMAPLSVAASPDGGFTVVGQGSFGSGGIDAFAMHLIPSTTAIVSQGKALVKSKLPVRTFVNGSTVTFSLNNPVAAGTTLTVYNATGKRVVNLTKSKSQTGSDSFMWDWSHFGKGLYLYRLQNNGGLVCGQVVVGR